MGWTSIPRGGVEILLGVHALESGIKASLMGRLAHMQIYLPRLSCGKDILLKKILNILTYCKWECSIEWQIKKKQGDLTGLFRTDCDILF